MAITKEGLQALAANRPTKTFPIPGTTETALLRKVSIAEYREAMKGATGDDNVAAAIAFLRVCWVDDEHRPMFAGKEGQMLLESLPVELLIPLFTEGIQFSGLDEKATEAAEKNS